ncbi:hypothetical protein IGI04_002784 [Brassica rapa subsp. trilocularis]|uniref:Uncharacterized protein n=1 Tax=Brassica rapa subsp. trilocularis TaxID=1813537 RepID=A0ABQ7NWI8_BRACM|nr:hypothetical protein IGI04_002784 [Brassica rapa subsp. trilocularis]
MAQFRVADKEIARLKDELEYSRCRERGSAGMEIRGAYRRGKREMAEVMKNRRDQFSREFGELKEWRMNERDMDFAIPHIEEMIWKQWELVPVSPDTVVAETRAPDETEEVNQLTFPLDVNDYSMEGSVTGYFDFDG